MALDRDTITAALKGVADPIAGTDIMASGVVRALNVDASGAVRFVMEIPPSHAKAFEETKAAAENALKKIDGVTQVSIVMTGHSEKPAPPDLKPNRPAEPKGPENIPGVIGSSQSPRVKGVLENRPSRRIWHALWHNKVAGSVC